MPTFCCKGLIAFAALLSVLCVFHVYALETHYQICEIAPDAKIRHDACKLSRPLSAYPYIPSDYSRIGFHVPPCIFNKNLLTHSPFQLLFAAIRASVPSQMARRFLHENDTALSALYSYWLMGIDIFYFRIVKPVTMYLLCLLYKLRCHSPMITHYVFLNLLRLYHIELSI